MVARHHEEAERARRSSRPRARSRRRTRAAACASTRASRRSRRGSRGSTTGRLPLAALSARATFFDDSGKSVPPVHSAGPSDGTIALARDVAGSRCRSGRPGCPPRCASQTIAVSAPDQRRQRSSQPPSWSTSARITARIANGRLRPGLVRSSKISPTRLEAVVGVARVRGRRRRRARRIARWRAARGRRSPGRDVGVAVVLVEDAVGVGEVRARSTAPRRSAP